MRLTMPSSTVALAEGLSHSPLSEAERRERIWSYDLFVTTRGMAGHFGESPAAGESLRPVFERNASLTQRSRRRTAAPRNADVQTRTHSGEPFAIEGN